MTRRSYCSSRPQTCTPSKQIVETPTVFATARYRTRSIARAIREYTPPSIAHQDTPAAVTATSAVVPVSRSLFHGFKRAHIIALILICFSLTLARFPSSVQSVVRALSYNPCTLFPTYVPRISTNSAVIQLTDIRTSLLNLDQLAYALYDDLVRLSDSESACSSPFSDESDTKTETGFKLCHSAASHATSILTESSEVLRDIHDQVSESIDFAGQKVQQLAKTDKHCKINEADFLNDLASIHEFVKSASDQLGHISKKFISSCITPTRGIQWYDEIYPQLDTSLDFASAASKIVQALFLKKLALALPEEIAIRRHSELLTYFVDFSFWKSLHSALTMIHDKHHAFKLLQTTRQDFEEIVPPGTELSGSYMFMKYYANPHWAMLLRDNHKAIEFSRSKYEVNLDVISRDEFLSNFEQDLSNSMTGISDLFLRTLAKSSAAIFELVELDKSYSSKFFKEATERILLNRIYSYELANSELPNLASKIHGAKLNSEFTSKSFFSTHNRLIQRLYTISSNIRYLLGRHHMPRQRIHSALLEEAAITGGWVFQEDPGTLALHLANPIYLQSIAIGNLPVLFSPTQGRAAAVHVEVWVEVENTDLRQTLQESTNSIYRYPCESYEYEDSEYYYLPEDVDTLADKYIKIGQFDYDLNLHMPMQSFPMPIAIAAALEVIPIQNIAYRFPLRDFEFGASVVGSVNAYGIPITN
ncbi:uncharacterized protein V1516DRAFT_674036 [Lipomyces oligophaga]|uniref:uncharacterized protein n=1 Tax=Lipomyces oligophaga TaxID=45792 RepID=UPI0034CF8E19